MGFLFRKLFGYGFAVLGGLIFFVALVLLVSGLRPWWQGEHMTKTTWNLLWPVGPIVLALGVGIFAAGGYLLRRRGGPEESAFSRAAGARRRNALTNVQSSTFLWPLITGLFYFNHGHHSSSATETLGVVFVGAVAVYLGFQGIIFCHELGHLGAAALLGMELHEFRVGTGPRLFSRRVGGLLIELRALLGGGIVRADDTEERGWRVRRWLFVAGGPAAHGLAVLALGGWLWWHVGAPRGLGWRWLALAWKGDAPAFFALWVLCLGGWVWVISLLPRAARFDALQARTDGYWLLRIPRLPGSEVRAQAIAALLRSAQFHWDRGEHEAARARSWQLLARYPESPAHAALEGEFLTREERHAEAAESFAQALLPPSGDAPPMSRAVRRILWPLRFAALVRADEPEAAREVSALALAETESPADRAQTLDDFATAATIPELRAFLPEADGWSQEALALEPDSLTRVCTRGVILADLGRYDEAEPLLLKVWSQSRRDLDAAVSAFALGLVARSRGRERELQHWRKRAESFAAIMPAWLNERVKRELQPATFAGTPGAVSRSIVGRAKAE